MLGGYGFIKEYPVQQYLRDLRAHMIIEETIRQGPVPSMMEDGKRGWRRPHWMDRSLASFGWGCKIEALGDKGLAGGERKAKKQATKPAAKPTQNKRHKPSQGNLPAMRCMKAEKTSQEAAAFYRDSSAEQAQKKHKCHWALHKKGEIKVRGAHISDEDIAEMVREEVAEQRKVWDSCTEQVEQGQIERQQKLRDNVKARRKTKPQTKMKSFKKDHIVPRF
ncbi:hypothetical protein HPB51_006565 [Rhipicephalus microplus]|uniref:Uncharacterized protein n=1 Tax=Rhipicephalus microplus TaxID=6941 RepID=A0A9J6E7M8_RHIMP|nr:hypothetical protein HPB51_006565 [Rhipicephalus microplus]